MAVTFRNLLNILGKCHFNYLAMPMKTSQILKSADFTKTQKSRYLENETLFFLQMKKFVNFTRSATLWQKNRFEAEVKIVLIFKISQNCCIFNPSRPNPGRREKIKLSFIFTFLCGASKGFMKPFEEPQRSVIIKISFISIYLSEVHGTLSINT